MTDRPPRRSGTAARAIRAILALQIAIAALLFSRDLGQVLPRLGLAPSAPRLELPVRPGDQLRRYDPRRAPATPARPDQPLPPPRDVPDRLRFERLDTARATLFGQIAPGDAERFADWIAGRDGVTALRLDSPGGSVADALDIGRRIRTAGLATEVAAGAQCLSACPYMLAGGIERRVDDAGFVGVHQHYFGENTALPAFIAVEDIQRGQAEVLDHLIDMGLDPALMRHSLATPPDEIYILLAEELARYRLSTGPLSK